MAGDRLRTRLQLIEAEYAWHMCCHFVKFKSIIFLKCSLEAISLKVVVIEPKVTCALFW